MKQIKGMQLGAVLAAMLILSMAFVPAVSAQAQNESGNGTSQQSCGKGQIADSNVKVNEKQLSISDKSKAVSIVLSDDGVKELRKELEIQGFKIGTDIKVIEATASTETESWTNLMVAIPFKGGEKEGALITYVSNENGKAAVATVLSKGAITQRTYDSNKGQTVQIQSVGCELCKWLVNELCGPVLEMGCVYGCAYLAVRIPNPLWAAGFWATCYLVCDFLGSEGCDVSADYACGYLGLC